MAIEKRKAQRSKVSPKVGFGASSGAGKTYSALRLAYGYCGDWSKICLIDSEGGRGELYANSTIKGVHIGEYDYIRLDPPFTPKRYIEAIKAAENDPNIEVIIVDSLSHAWAGTGGILDMKNAFAQSDKENDFTAWRKVTPEHNTLVDSVLRSRCAVFMTLRHKTEYVIEENSKGQKIPRKIGLAPVFRDGIEFEATVYFDLSQEHYANATKDNTGLFDGQPQILTEENGKQLKAWFDSGAEVKPSTPLPSDDMTGERWVNFWKAAEKLGYDQMGVIVAACGGGTLQEFMAKYSTGEKANTLLKELKAKKEAQ